MLIHVLLQLNLKIIIKTLFKNSLGIKANSLNDMELIGSRVI